MSEVLDSQKAQALRESNRALMTEVLRRLGSQDYQGACELMTEDVVCDWPYPPTPTSAPSIRGRDAMQAFFSGGMDAFDPYRYEITEVFELVDPTRLIAEYHSNSRLKKTNAPYQNHYLSIFHFDGGLVTYWREYINPVVVADVLATLDSD